MMRKYFHRCRFNLLNAVTLPNSLETNDFTYSLCSHSQNRNHFVKNHFVKNHFVKNHFVKNHFVNVRDNDFVKKLIYRIDPAYANIASGICVKHIDHNIINLYPYGFVPCSHMFQIHDLFQKKGFDIVTTSVMVPDDENTELYMNCIFDDIYEKIKNKPDNQMTFEDKLDFYNARFGGFGILK